MHVHRRRRPGEGHDLGRLRGPAGSGQERHGHQGKLGTVKNLSYEDLANNIWVAGNIVLDLQAASDGGCSTSPRPTPTTTGGAGGTGTGTAPTVAGGDTNAQITVTADPTVLAEQYPPVPGGLVVDNPNVQVGGEATFRGSGCVPNEVCRSSSTTSRSAR